MNNSNVKHLDRIRSKQGFICDMDGVIYHGNKLLEGVKEFIHWLHAQEKRYLFLTNSSERSPLELQHKLQRMGLTIDKKHFYTSAQATAAFLSSQLPGGSAYVIGEPGLIHALYEAGYSMNEVNPDYVVVGESRNYNLDTVTRAVNLVIKGAKLIGTNPDLTGPIEQGIMPATGSLISPIALATRREPYFVGKPNPLMMRHAMNQLGTSANETVIIGDRMDTDIIAGIESGIDTVLVFSGVTDMQQMKTFAYSPTVYISGVEEIPRCTT